MRAPGNFWLGQDISGFFPPPPVSHAVLSALVCWLMDTGQSGMGLALYVSFFGYLRARETLNLRRSDVVLPGDSRLPPAGERLFVDPGGQDGEEPVSLFT
jgi:hypothetical protein